jgi:HSP20 family protein
MKSLIRWDPFRMVRRWEPFDEIRFMQREMDSLFNRLMGSSATRELGTWTPSIESYIRDNKLVVKAELPGVESKDLDVTVLDRELIVKGERKQEKDTKEENYVYREINYGSFERHFALPEGVKTEDLKAKFTNGLLEITVPLPAVVKAQKVEIETTKEEKTQAIEEKKAA